MKKILLAALAAIAVAGTAWASGPSVPTHIKYEQVHFITSAAATGNGGVSDSLQARRVGAAGASSVLDTTAAISTESWMFYNPSVLADTTNQFCMLLIHSSMTGGDDGCESGADSLAVAMQVSADGVTWATCAALPAQSAAGATAPIVTRNNQTILNGAFMDRLSLNGAALANGQPLWMFRYKLRGAQQFADISEGSTQFFPYIRFILSFHDAKGYKVAGKIGHWSAID